MYRNKLRIHDPLNLPPCGAGFVPKAGLEPACLATHAPETCASTNFATSAGLTSSQPGMGHRPKVAHAQRYTQGKGFAYL